LEGSACTCLSLWDGHPALQRLEGRAPPSRPPGERHPALLHSLARYAEYCVTREPPHLTHAPTRSSLAGAHRPADPAPRHVECVRYRRGHHTSPPGEKPESRATLRSCEIATRWRGRGIHPLDSRDESEIASRKNSSDRCVPGGSGARRVVYHTLSGACDMRTL